MHCNACHSDNEPGANFCAHCGNPLDAPDGPDTRGDSGSKGKTKFFYGKAKYLKEAVRVADRFLASQGLVTQEVESGPDLILQGKMKPNIFKKALGLDQAVTVSFASDRGDLKMTIGGAKWIDKAAGAGVGWFIFAPAILTTGWGIYKQKRLFENVESELEAYLASKP